MKCPVCQFDNNIVLGSIEGYQRGHHFEVLACRECGTHFANPMKSVDTIYQAIYGQVEMIPGYSRYRETADLIAKSADPLSELMDREDAYWAIGTALDERARSTGREFSVLEVGCGQGYLTHCLVAAGYKAHGIDISDTAIELARRRFGDHYSRDTIESYVARTAVRPKYIVLSEVIEHVEAPYDFLKSLLSALAEGGSIIATTPNRSAHDHTAVWDTDLPPVHLTWITTRGFEMLGEGIGAKVEFLDLGQFYENNPKFLYHNDASKGMRPSILDEDFCVTKHYLGSMSAAKKPPAVASKSVLVRWLVNRAKRVRAKLIGRMAFDGKRPGVICVILTK